MRNSHRILKFVVLILATHSSWAQQQGNIRGTVVDQSTKQPLAGANVQIMGTELGSSTNAEGVFVINNLPEDVYKIKVSYLGYLSRLETDVRVIRNKTTSIQEIGLVETTLEGSEVIVTPGLQAEIETMPVSSTVFSREEIRRTAGTGGDVLRAASVLPGVSTTAGEFSTFSVRGGGPRDNLILIDNIPFDKISHFEGGSSEQEVQGGRFSVFSSGLIEKVTFSAGGYGPEYGRKSASVMDLTMKEGNMKTPTMDAAFDPGGGEFNYDGPAFIHDNTSVVFNARYYDYSRLLEAMDMAKLFYPAFGDVILKTTTEVNPGNRISVLGIYSKDDLYRDRKNLFAADDLVENDVWDIKETRSILGLNWRLLTGSQSVLHNTFYYRGNERRRSAGNAWGPSGTVLPPSQNDISLRRDIIKQNQDEIEIGWKSDFTQVLGNNATLNTGVELFSIGLDYQTIQNGNDTIYTFDRRDPRPDPALYYLVTTPEMTANHFDNRTEQLGAYLTPSFKIGERFSLSPGLRYEWNGLNDQSTFSPRVQAKFHLNPRTVVNAAAGVYYQNPLYGDIAASPENVRLKNEQALHAIVGVSRQFGEDIKVTVEAYYKKFDDLIVRADHSSIAMKNQGAGWSRGLDILVQKRFTGNCYAQMTYSYSASKRNDRDGLGEYNAPYSQPHLFNLLGGYQVNKKLFVSAKLHCATGRPKHKYVVHENVFNDPNLIRYSQEITDRYADRLMPFVMLDARIDYRLQLGRLALVTFLDLTNILNRYNATEERFSELSGKEKPLGFGFIPTFGFKLEL